MNNVNSIEEALEYISAQIQTMFVITLMCQWILFCILWYLIVN